MRCYRCHTTNAPGADECRECGATAFYRGARPTWPPVLTTPCTCEKAGGGRLNNCSTPHQLFAAFLLGPIPKPPVVALRSSRDVARPNARAGR